MRIVRKHNKVTSMMDGKLCQLYYSAITLVVAAAATTAVANFLRADPVSTLQIFSNQCCSVMLSLATI